MIDLLNRRFVPFFFNTGGPGLGRDPAAEAFVKGKTTNKWAFFALFTPTGECLGSTEIYADKDAVFHFLQQHLAARPEAARATDGEQRVIEAGTREGANVGEQHEAARLLEALGRYDEASKLYASVIEKARGREGVESRLAMMRIYRYRGEWTAHEALNRTFLEDAKTCSDCGAEVSTEWLEDDDAAETGYRLLARKEHAKARELLQEAAHRLGNGDRVAEIHFLAGVACWFLGDRDWAKFHWGWILRHRPEDRLYMRAYVAAAAETMPYPNPELGNFEAPGMIGPQHIPPEVGRSLGIHDELAPRFAAGELTWARAKPKDEATVKSTPAGELVARLKDGNEHRVANNEIVKALMDLGKDSIAPLVRAAGDDRFAGRGYAAWALGLVLAVTGERPEEALSVLHGCLEARNPYVVGLASSGRRAVDAADRGEWKHPWPKHENR